MTIHGGSGSLSSRSTKVEVTTTLYELMEAIGDKVGGAGAPELGMSGSMAGQSHPSQDRLIARKVDNLFLSGKIRFKHPRDIRNTFPEWFD